jgi:preprotein translocase subunit SecE
MANPLKFAQDVRAEVRKVTWPTRNETVVTTVMVFILVFLASLFFFLADQILSWAVGALLDWMS